MWNDANDNFYCNTLYNNNMHKQTNEQIQTRTRTHTHTCTQPFHMHLFSLSSIKKTETEMLALENTPFHAVEHLSKGFLVFLCYNNHWHWPMHKRQTLNAEQHSLFNRIIKYCCLHWTVGQIKFAFVWLLK